MRITPLFLLVLVILIPCGAYNISVGEVGASYIQWDIANNKTPMWLDGVETPVYGSVYIQHELTPNSQHIGCIENETCISVTTQTDGLTVFNYWIVFLILVAFCIVCYFVPIGYIPSLIYSLYLISTYLPSINAGFNEYLLTAILMIMNILSSIVGMRR